MTPETASVIAAAVAGGSAVVVAVITTYGHRRTRGLLAENTEKTEQVLHQVKNDHGTNLRDDLDRVTSDLSRLASMVGNVAKEIRDTRRDQKAHDAASALVVAELHKTDAQLAAEIRHHHPPHEADSSA